MFSKNTFSTEHLQATASEFLQKDIDKFIDCQTNESTKKIHIRRKKAKHGTERNELKCHNGDMLFSRSGILVEAVNKTIFSSNTVATFITFNDSVS